MKVSFSKDFGTINFSLDEQNYEEDLVKCHRIQKMMETEAWADLMLVFLKGKEKFDETVMKVKPSEQSFRENAIYSARLGGFWEAVSLSTKIVDAYKKFRGDKIKELEGQSEESIIDNS